MSGETEPEKPTSGAGETDSFFRGTVVRMTFRSDDSGFTVMRAEAEGQNASLPGQGLITIVGPMPGGIAPGTSFIARGAWHVHPKFGKQFRAHSITEAEPTTEEAIIRYLSSGSIKGFGAVLAERVVAAFGENTLKILDDTPRRLLEVPGIGKKKLEEISSAWQEKRNLRQIMLFFQQHKVSLGLAQRIYNAYGERAIEVVSQNPYILAREVWGVGFRTADKIAQALGLDRCSKERLIAGLCHALESAESDGHCYLPQEEFYERAEALLEVDERKLLEQAASEAGLRAFLVKDGERVYLPHLHAAEIALARRVAARIAVNDPALPIIPQQLIQQACEGAYTGGSSAQGVPNVIRLSEQQQRAIELAATRRLLVITGGPGCGKTTVLQAVASLYRRAGLRAKLAAPTGRAAQRMAEVCSMPASTIHRMLGFDPIRRAFVHDQHELLECDACIIDESSMIDLPLATSLFSALPNTARIVIVGDADQLPSVGPGRILGDLLSIPQVPRVELTTLFRRSDESNITAIAHQINHAEIPRIPAPDGQTKTDAYFLECRELPEAAAMIERLVVEQVPKKFGYSGSEIMVLTPMNQGDLGVVALNARLQQRLVPQGLGLPSVKVGGLEFRLRDRVCQRVNNYNLHANGVFNGDQGEIIGIDAEAKSIFVRLWDGREIEYPSESLNQLDLAYALTIHRSQGSEVPVVILVLHESHTIMLERQLIYTGVTRAKRLLIIVGTKKALGLAVKRSRSVRRYTALVERTAEYI